MQQQQQQQQDHSVHLELWISCRDLKVQNPLYLPDPGVSVFKINTHKEIQYIGETEVLKHNVNPDFKQTIKIDYNFGHRTRLMFQARNKNKNILGKLVTEIVAQEETEDMLGQCTVDLAELVGAKNGLSKIPLNVHGQQKGTLIVFVDRQEQHEEATHIGWKWQGLHLKEMGWIGKGAPFIKFYRYTDQKKLLIYESERIKNTGDPKWKAWNTTKEKLCPTSNDFYVEVYDYHSIGKHSFVGSAVINFQDIIEKRNLKFQLQDEKKKNTGSVEVTDLQIQEPPPINKEITYIDYLKGNWQLQLVVGIDFTFSNGPISKNSSLHYLSNEQQNYYQLALEYVGNTIVGFDFEKNIPVFGFGGIPKLPNYTKPYVEHCFPLNGNPQNPICKEISGVLEAYKQAVPNIEFSGPTFVSEILSSAKSFVEKKVNTDIYTIMLGLTDGQIEDMDDMFQLIGECSVLPMSVIIVGIGDEDFSSMHKLDNLNEISKHVKNEEMRKKLRQITQFIAFQEVGNDVEQLTQSVLHTLSQQFMEYVKINGHEPKKGLKVQLSQVN